MLVEPIQTLIAAHLASELCEHAMSGVGGTYRKEDMIAFAVCTVSVSADTSAGGQWVCRKNVGIVSGEMIDEIVVTVGGIMN